MSSEITIEELDLSVRAYNCLKRAGINTLSEFVSRMETDFASLIAVRNLGRKSLEEVLVKLKKRGLPCEIHLKRYMQTLSVDDAKAWEGVYQGQSLYMVGERKSANGLVCLEKNHSL